MDTNIYHRMLGMQSFVHLYAMEPFIEVENYMHHYGIATFPKIEMSFPVLICRCFYSTLLDKMQW